MSADSEINEAAGKAIDSADFLHFVNALFLALALVGAAILAFIGMSAEAQTGGEVFIIMGVAILISAVPLFALMRAVAMGTHLAGIMARTSNYGRDDEVITESSVPVVRVRQAFSDLGCATCGSRNLRGTVCKRCSGEATELESAGGWYVTLDDLGQERYFDGHAWTNDYRDATRFTIDIWDTTQPGWIQDPSNPNLDRFWDGRTWTTKVKDAWGDDETEVPVDQ